jgi:hypothetical protein
MTNTLSRLLGVKGILRLKHFPFVGGFHGAPLIFYSNAELSPSIGLQFRRHRSAEPLTHNRVPQLTIVQPNGPPKLASPLWTTLKPRQKHYRIWQARAQGVARRTSALPARNYASKPGTTGVSQTIPDLHRVDNKQF